MSARPAALVASLALLACASGPRLPGPPEGPHTVPVSQWIEVETLPPSVEVEDISPRPSKLHLWIDGDWAYQPVTHRWVWEQGRWCIPPEGALYYARSRAVRDRQPIAQGDSVQRSTRWNELEKRMERVDVARDSFRWLKGSFYGRGPDGNPTPLEAPVRCEVGPRG